MRWCQSHGVDRGATMTLPQAWALSQRWYGDRLDPGFRRRTTDEAREIFTSVGLTGTFWQL